MCVLSWTIITCLGLIVLSYANTEKKNVFYCLRFYLVTILFFYFVVRVYIYPGNDIPIEDPTYKLIEAWTFFAWGIGLIICGFEKSARFLYNLMFKNHDAAISAYAYTTPEIRQSNSGDQLKPTKKNIESTIDSFLGEEISETVVPNMERIISSFNTHLKLIRKSLFSNILAGLPLIWIGFSLITFSGVILKIWRLTDNVQNIDISTISFGNCFYFVLQLSTTLGTGDIVFSSPNNQEANTLLFFIVGTSLLYLSVLLATIISFITTSDSYVDNTISNKINSLYLKDISYPEGKLHEKLKELSLQLRL